MAIWTATSPTTAFSTLTDSVTLINILPEVRFELIVSENANCHMDFLLFVIEADMIKHF